MGTERQPLTQPCRRCSAPAGTVPIVEPFRAEYKDEDTEHGREAHEMSKKACAACGSPVEYCDSGMSPSAGHPHRHHPSAFPDLGPLIFRRVCRDYKVPTTCPACNRSHPPHLFSTAINATWVEGDDRKGVPIWKRVRWWQSGGTGYFYTRFGGRVYHREDNTLEACDYCYAASVCALCQRRYAIGHERTQERWLEYIHTGEKNRDAQTLMDELDADPKTRRCPRCRTATDLSDDERALMERLARQ